MGKLLKPRGLKGELWMTIFNEVDSALRIRMKIWVASENGEFSIQIIESFKITERKSWIKFEGCRSREDADNLRGLNFSIPRSGFTLLDGNKFYLVDIIGSTVLDEDRKVIGWVISYIFTVPSFRGFFLLARLIANLSFRLISFSIALSPRFDL